MAESERGRLAGGAMLVMGAIGIAQFLLLLVATVVRAAVTSTSFPGFWVESPSFGFLPFPPSWYGPMAVVSLIAAVVAIVGAIRAFSEPRDNAALAGAVAPAAVLPPWGALVAVACLALLWTAEPAAAEPRSQSTSEPTREPATAEATSVREAPTPEPGEQSLAEDATFQDRYRVLEHLGTGGMGRTFRARDTVIDRDVVLKELLPHLKRKDRHLQAFLREARIAGGLDHPHVVRLYDVVRTNGETVLVLEYVAGGSLADRIDQGALDLAEAAGLLDQLLDALAALHDQEILHRDVKPHNVLLTPDGRVKLTDFGIAHVPGGDTLVTHDQPGTVRYMAPEQIQGGDVDDRADLYATTALFYEMLTGRPYLDFEGRTLYEAQRAVVEEQPNLPVGDLPEEVNDLLAQGLAKDPGDRPASAAEMRKAVGSFTAP